MAVPSCFSASGTLQLARLERADAGRDDDRARVEPRAAAGLHIEPPIVALHDGRDFLPQVHTSAERLDLFLQPIDEFLRRAHRHVRNVEIGLSG